MAKFAPIAPISLVPELQKHSVFGDYHLLLAHDVLAKPETYASAYKGKGYTIIMDNSMIEMGKALPAKDLSEASVLVGATYVVLPDIMHQYLDTTIAASIAVEEFYKLSTHTQPQFMGVVQGNTYDEYVRCAHALIERCGVSILGIPKAVGKLFRTRHVLVGLLNDLEVPIHLLGFTDDLADDFYCASLGGVVGIDSAMPLWMGQKGSVLPRSPVPHSSMYGSRPANFFDNPETEPNVCTLANINIVRSWLMTYEERLGLEAVKSKMSMAEYVRASVDMAEKEDVAKGITR